MVGFRNFANTPKNILRTLKPALNVNGREKEHWKSFMNV
jgi:hypothetical protein